MEDTHAWFRPPPAQAHNFDDWELRQTATAAWPAVPVVAQVAAHAPYPVAPLPEAVGLIIVAVVRVKTMKC